jgi:chaperone BCS1
MTHLLVLYNFFTHLAKTNQVFAGLMGMYGLGVVTFFVRNIPARFISFIKEETTTNVSVSGRDEIYYDLMRWLGKNKVHSYVRNLSFNNSSRWGSGDPMLTIGLGTTYFRVDGRLVKMTMGTKNDTSANSPGTLATEAVTLTVFGRSHKIFHKLFEVIQEKEDEVNRLKIHFWKGYWSLGVMQHRRGFETIAIPEAQKHEIIKHLDDFLKDKDFRVTNGIPYRTGLLFRGGPGMGKTSIIKAICAHLKRDLYLLDLSGLNDMQMRDALSRVPEGAVVAIEDIDTAGIGKRKVKAPAQQGVENGAVSEEDKKAAEAAALTLTLSGVLNAIDGPASGEGHILIATTNCPDALDEALIREGRFDLKMDIGPVTEETLQTYMRRMYPRHALPEVMHVKANTPACKVQALVMKHRKDPLTVLKEVTYQ